MPSELGKHALSLLARDFLVAPREALLRHLKDIMGLNDLPFDGFRSQITFLRLRYFSV
jgi:hypothetical protein